MATPRRTIDRANSALFGLFLTISEHIFHFLVPAHTTNKMILSIQYFWVILHNYFIIRNCSSRGPVLENDVEWLKIDPKLQKVVFLCFSVRCHGNMCNLNMIVVLDFISRDLYLLFAILFSSKFQNSFLPTHEAETRP